mgnify:CR=1 FL=1
MVALAPCIIPSINNYVAEREISKEMYAFIAGIFELLDIESLFGPNWSKQLKDLCNILGGEGTAFCTYFGEVPVGPIAGGDIMGYSEISVQQVQHIAQIVLEQKF